MDKYNDNFVTVGDNSGWKRACRDVREGSDRATEGVPSDSAPDNHNLWEEFESNGSWVIFLLRNGISNLTG